MIKKLSQEVVNQIAAGEVVERPASVVKELLDNAIDAQANKIDIKIKNGGISYIEISDNGLGISEKDLPNALEAHATSKIESLEDLNEILSMGFRGEALSTIVSVASVTITSKEKISDYGFQIVGKGVETSKAKKSPRDTGTTVIVENLFEEIPARKKYLRAESTEYRKILETLTPYFLIYPNIHFTLTNNGKQIYNLPKVEDLQLRISAVLKGEFTKDMLKLFFDGEGMKISGFIAQPKYNFNKTIHHYIFVNKRPIYDRGIVRAVSEGFSRFIPEGSKVPFVLNLEIKTSLIDVNVHPRKEEIRFMNPFRVYTAVEEAVKKALQNYSAQTFETKDYSSFSMQDKPREINYKKQSNYNIQSGLEFSKHLLKPKSVEKNQVDSLFSTTQEESQESEKSFYQIFNKYIITEFENEIWIIDQHAASERISYEKIQNDFENKSVEIQSLLIPIEIELSDVEILFIKENEKVFESFGFKLKIIKSNLQVKEAPSMLISSDFEKFFQDLTSELDTAKDVKKLQQDLISTIACHASIRAGQKLHQQEMREIIIGLKKCQNSTTCPHGRPAIWKLSRKEIDKNFYRTY
jgi:DNA mismatch repair protein MutL